MSKIEVVRIRSEEMNKEVNAVSVDGVVFDWSMDPREFSQAKSLIHHHAGMKETIMLSVTNHFLQSFCEFIGRDITLAQFNKAILSGELE